MDRWELLDRVACDGIVTAEQAMAAGLARHDIASMRRSGRWQRLGRGVYLIRSDGNGDRISRIRATVVAAGPNAFAVLDSAAELHGIAGLPRPDRIHVGVPASDPHRQRLGGGVALHQFSVSPDQLSVVRGIQATGVARTLADLLLRLPRYEAVCVLDSALNRKLLTLDEFATIPDLLRRRPGAVRARQRLAEVNDGARSPLETRVRLRCVDGGVAPDRIGYLVRDELGGVLAEADLAWLAPKVIAEADGKEVHSLPEAVFQDRRRQNVLANAGWLVLRFTWADTVRPGYIADAVRQALVARLPNR